MTGAGLLTGRVVAMAGVTGKFTDLIARGLRDHRATTTTLEDDRPIDGVVHSSLDPLLFTPSPFDVLDDQAWDDQCEGILRSALDTCRLAYPRLSERGGRVVFVTSAVSLVGAAGCAPYIAALEGVRALAKSAARQWGTSRITVNCVAPAVGEGPPPTERMALGQVPDVRVEVAAVVAFLLSDAASGVTGTTITVDGGSQMRP